MRSNISLFLNLTLTTKDSCPTAGKWTKDYPPPGILSGCVMILGQPFMLKENDPNSDPTFSGLCLQLLLLFFATNTTTEDLLIQNVEEYLDLLCDQNSWAVIGHGSLFPEISHVKKYLRIHYGVDLAQTRVLNCLLSRLAKDHKPQQAATFTAMQVECFLTCKGFSSSLPDIQQMLVCALAYYGLLPM